MNVEGVGRPLSGPTEVQEAIEQYGLKPSGMDGIFTSTEWVLVEFRQGSTVLGGHLLHDVEMHELCSQMANHRRRGSHPGLYGIPRDRVTVNAVMGMARPAVL